MARFISNMLKAMLVVEDISDPGVQVRIDNGFVVQHFSYECHRQRNDAGTPYGPTVPSYLDFIVKVASEDSGKVFFDRMQRNETFPYSFLFNASFNNIRRLSDCEDAMVATGYIVDMEESFESAPAEDGSSEQMLIHARLLISNLTYLGKERTMKLIITND